MQTWKTSEVPDRWKSSPKSIRTYMPDWKYVLMTDEMNREFVQSHFPDFLSTYDNFPHPIQRADAIRYMWLYVHGGLYLDLDFELLHSLESLFSIPGEVFLAKSGNIGSVITNSLMASRPGARLWLDMLKAIQNNWGMQPWMVGKHLTVMNTTGPMMLNRVVLTSQHPYELLPSELIMPCSVCEIQDGVCDTSRAYLRPLEGQSWNSWDSRVINVFLCRWKQILWLILAIILIGIAIWVSRNYRSR